ncbi:hypothetical protein [Halobacteriaceae bacterium SHR40]|uniref:hypothetical protein n=1 Tax=Halovenus amylolytica TaxID=2500550 RepID=UPI000FE3DF58
MDTNIFKSKGYFLTVVIIGSVLAGVLTALFLGAGATELGYVAVGGIGSALVVVGTYTLGRRYGHPHSHAVAEAAISLGVLYLIAVSFRLLTEYGERSFFEVVFALGALIVGSLAFVAAIAVLGRYNASPS